MSPRDPNLRTLGGDDVLDYARPGTGRPVMRPRGFKHALAICFATVAIPIGLLFFVDALGFYRRALNEPTTRERRLFRQDATQFLVCSLLLMGSGTWYGRAGFLGDPADDDRA